MKGMRRVTMQAGLAEARTKVGADTATTVCHRAAVDGRMPLMRRLWNEFKSFAMSGNMLDLALGFIIGAAFAKIIDSMVSNVLMQLVAIIFGQPDFTSLTINWNGGEIRYGAF